ncbi:MAG: photosystem II cytochrome PsbV2 [Oscillatoriales cyanobacterium C42_A2020_001]|nr:photosystem II cytochrome PsbV2 [Leptolyngbyaceae cyanobacterium C42_A2020_001]
MLRRSFWLHSLVCILTVCLTLVVSSAPAYATTIDPYVTRYLRVTEPIPLVLDDQGNTRLFTPVELSKGKALFEKNCLSCHVGGTTLPDPTVPLSLAALRGATPQRDTINGLVAFLRQPMTYDGSEEAILCQRLPDSWLATADVEAIAGFVLRAAQKAPGWGTETFENS